MRCKKCHTVHNINKNNIFNHIDSIQYMLLGQQYIEMCVNCGYIFRISIPKYIPLEQVTKYIKEIYE